MRIVPALTLTGAIGDRIRVDAINQVGPVDAWFTLDTVTLTNTTQLYFDTAAIGNAEALPVGARAVKLSTVDLKGTAYAR